MSWFKKDDKIYDSPKFIAAGIFGRALWDAAGVKCSSRNGDGVVDPILLRLAAYCAGFLDDPDLLDLLGADKMPRADVVAGKLVKVGLWHDARTLRRCERCMQASGGKLDAGHFYFHDWIEYQLTAASQVSEHARWKDARKRRLLRNKKLRADVHDRDGTLCRYCAKRVEPDDHRSDDGMEYDHVDPDGDNSLDNVVVACRGCNNFKGERTPGEAGMTLLAPGTARPALEAVDPIPIRDGSETVSERHETEPENNRVGTETVTENTPAGTETDPNSRAPRSRRGTGSGRIGNVSEHGSETCSGRDGSDQAGTGQAGGGSGPGHGPVSGESEASA